MMRQRRRASSAESGFIVSVELLLISVILVAGLLSAWAKLRDQSAAELRDTIAAIDEYLTNATSFYEPFEQMWIVGAGVVQPSPTTPIPATAITEAYTSCVVFSEGCAHVNSTAVTGTPDLTYVPATGE